MKASKFTSLLLPQHPPEENFNENTSISILTDVLHCLDGAVKIGAREPKLGSFYSFVLDLF